MTPPQWQPMSEKDISAVLAIADIVHPDFPEDEAIFKDRLALYPTGCFVLERRASNWMHKGHSNILVEHRNNSKTDSTFESDALVEKSSIVGYGISHPWRSGQFPALNTVLGSLPPSRNSYYIHDIALHPQARSLGAASRLITMMTDQAIAGGYRDMALVAVNGSRLFWEKQGFSVHLSQEYASRLKTYSDDAVYMVRSLEHAGFR